MPDLQVISACTRRAGLLSQYEEQLAAADIPFHLESFDSMPNFERGSLGLRIAITRKMAEKFKHCAKLVFTDAWDMLFYGTAEEVFSKIPEDWPLLAAERNCWPDGYLAAYIKTTGTWRFVNGGASAGTPESILKWCDAVERHPAYHPGYIDQQWLNHRLLDGSMPMVIDVETNLFYCMVMEAGELNCKLGKPVNTITGKNPNFIHFNSRTDPTLFLWRWAVSAGKLKGD